MSDTADPGNTIDRGTPLRPLPICKLAEALGDLHLLVFSANRWAVREDWINLVTELRPHLKAAALIVERYIEGNRERVAMDAGDRECFDVALAELRLKLDRDES
jgi:hypothetical protein